MGHTLVNVAEQDEVRVLKIQPVYRTHKRRQTMVPEIKLAGNWLNDLGFTPKQHVIVTTRPHYIVIQLKE